MQVREGTALRDVGGPRLAAVVALMILAPGWGGSVAHAQTLDDDDPPGVECVGNTTGSVNVTPATIELEQSVSQSVTVRWSVQAPSGCGGVAQTLNGRSVARSGSITEVVMSTTRYVLRATMSGASRTLAADSVTVQLPRYVDITGNDQERLLLQALRTPDTVIKVADHVQIDLSGHEGIPIAAGVQLTGGHTPRVPGARLYTRTFPKRLFVIGPWSDNVRITGMRIDGGEMGVAASDTEASMGITVDSSLNVAIANSEVYGWRGAAIEVRDYQNRISLANRMTVRIHDNFIHHNQHHLASGVGAIGYGVNVSNGAYALIEKNVFNWNRHAIASDGRPETGYVVYRNLVLEDGGLSYWAAGFWVHTHMFDMHGRESCGIESANCGPAGEYMDIRYNTFLYTAGTAFNLRGTPSMWAEVAHNAFKHESLWTHASSIPPYPLIVGAMIQNESVIPWDNQLDVDESDNYVWCDFDADGVDDKFFATGVTWWYASGGAGHWAYLNSSTTRLSELTLGYFDDDAKCDVSLGGRIISSGGTGPWRPRVGDILWQNTVGQLSLWSIEGGMVGSEAYPGSVDSSWQVRGTGDFSGDGHDDILWQQTTGQVAIWNLSRGSRVGEVYPGGKVPSDWTIQGLGDFDGDGRSDILWRDDTGQLAIWFKGNPTDSLSPAAYPGYAGSPLPVDPSWQVKGVGDFNGDGRADILWRHTKGQVAIWHMAGGTRISDAYPGGAVSALLWTIQGVGDFDADGRSDILWRDSSGYLAIWFGGEATRAVSVSYRNAGSPLALSWKVQGVADYNGDGRSDILWRSSDGQVGIWWMAGGRFAGDAYPRWVDALWQIKGVMSHPR